MSKHLRAPHFPPADKAKSWWATEEDRAEQPVFDAGKHDPVSPYIRAGLTPTGKMVLHLKRDGRDRKPGTPVPFHEPDPDRFAKAEAIRKAILERDARLAAREADPVVRKSRAEWRANAPRKIPDIPNPDTNWCCPPEEAAVSAARDGRTLYFASVKNAERAFDGGLGKQRIKNALSGMIENPYGWQWTRLESTRGGRPKTRGKM